MRNEMKNVSEPQKNLAMETIGDLERQLERLKKLAMSAIIALTVVIIGLLTVNYRHTVANKRFNVK